MKKENKSIFVSHNKKNVSTTIWCPNQFFIFNAFKLKMNKNVFEMRKMSILLSSLIINLLFVIFRWLDEEEVAVVRVHNQVFAQRLVKVLLAIKFLVIGRIPLIYLFVVRRMRLLVFILIQVSKRFNTKMGGAQDNLQIEELTYLNLIWGAWLK